MKNWYQLDFTGNFFGELNFSFPERKWQVANVPRKSISKEGNDYLKKIKVTPFLPFGDILFFSGQPYESSVIHTDRLTQNGILRHTYAINFIKGSNESEMVWYDLVEGAVGVDTIDISKTNYITYQPEEVLEIERVKNLVGKLVLVRTDIPHCVFNPTNIPRFCLSVRGAPLLPWEQIVDYLSAYIIE